MGLRKRSQFFYGIEIIADNQDINFDEGSGELLAELNIGTYGLSSFTTEIARAMNSAGTQEYTVTADRSNRFITISAPGAFDLLFDTGANSLTSAATIMGFAASDFTGTTSYEGTSGSGSVYRPQFYLQSYTPFGNFVEYTSGRVNESASGIVETVSFGTRSFMECDITWSTDIEQGTESAIETNLNGLSDLRQFLNYIFQKGNLEFMEDRDDPDVFTPCLLERTKTSSDGISFKIQEVFNKNIADYYDTGLLRFRDIT